jgi:pyruvate dehydrogenase E1 component beta subunit
MKRVVNTGIDENWMASCVLGAGLAGSKAVTYIPYQGNCMCFQVIQNHAGKLRHMTGGAASMPVVFLLEITGQTPGFAGQHSDWYLADIARRRRERDVPAHDYRGPIG